MNDDRVAQGTVVFLGLQDVNDRIVGTAYFSIKVTVREGGI